MGTVVTVDVRTPAAADVLEAAIDEVVAWLHWVDATFSTWRLDSAVSRLARGGTTLRDCPPAVAEVLAAADRARIVTGGGFDAAWRGDGTLDPTGLVKGWAAEHASSLLSAAGLADHFVNAAGDVRARGHAAIGQPWRVGIEDPRAPGEVLATVTGVDLAVATSGIGQRGRHVQDPTTGRPADGLLAVTVVGPDLTRADAYATGALALGRHATALLTRLDASGWSSLLVTAGGGVWASAGFHGRVTEPSVQAQCAAPVTQRARRVRHWAT